MLGEDEELHLGIVEQPLRVQHLAELSEFGFHFTLLENLGLLNQLRQPDDFVPKNGRVDGQDLILQFVDDLLLLLFG